MHVNTRTQCHLWLRKFNIFDVSLSFMSFYKRLMLPHDVSFYHACMHVRMDDCVRVCAWNLTAFGRFVLAYFDNTHTQAHTYVSYVCNSCSWRFSLVSVQSIPFCSCCLLFKANGIYCCCIFACSCSLHPTPAFNRLIWFKWMNNWTNGI